MQNKYLKAFAPLLVAVSLVACDQKESNANTEAKAEATTDAATQLSAAQTENGEASSVKLETPEQRVAYAISTQVGAQLKQQFDNEEMPIDFATFQAGLNDMLDGKTPAMNEEEVESELNEFSERMSAQAEERMAKVAQENTAFLEENKQKEGVTVTESGLQYEVLESGEESGQSPKATDVVKVNYVGKLIDGTEFDNSYNRDQAAEFPLNGVIPGWTEVLQLMRPGDKWRVTIPSELGYGQVGAGSVIPPNSTLVFDIELLEVVKQEADNAAQSEQPAQ